jgi:hypothetical protein
MDKTEAIFLNGRQNQECITFFEDYNISQWHDRSSRTPMRYLGFPFIASLQQRKAVENKILTRVQSRCLQLSNRRLPLRGKVTVMNSLVLSTLWYVLQVVSLPRTFFKALQSIIGRFINIDIKPPIAFGQLCRPVSDGGLGLIDPQAQ